ncbi:MAG: hypothetical protein WCH00_02245 [Candidatus Saccharibacteria bacterium]
MTSATALRRNQNITRNKLSFQTGPFSVGLLLLGFVIVLSLLYLNQITKTSVFNYKISNLQNTQANLTTEKQKLQIEAARVQSLAQAKANATSAGLIKTDTVSYATAH